MFSSKNISTQQTAAFSAIIIAVAGTLLVWIFTRNWLEAVTTLGITFFLGYILIHFFFAAVYLPKN